MKALIKTMLQQGTPPLIVSFGQRLRQAEDDSLALLLLLNRLRS
jgi:hypothetical protein